MGDLEEQQAPSWPTDILMTFLSQLCFLTHYPMTSPDFGDWVRDVLEAVGGIWAPSRRYRL